MIVSCYRRSVRVACVVVVALATSCTAHEFVCNTSDQCVDGTVQGTCEVTSFCSFPDASCTSQQRYGELAADGLANQCVDVSPNLVLNSTCDDDTSNWLEFQSTVSLSTTARTGAHSCMVCDAGFIDFTMDDDQPTVPSADPGEMFVGRAWVRAAPGAASPTTVYFETRDSTTNTDDTSEMVSVNGAWQQVTVTHTVGMATQPVEVVIIGHTETPSTNPCFLVDDITLVRVSQ